MTEQNITNELIIEHLKAIRSEIKDLRFEVTSQGERLIGVERHLSGLMTTLTNVGGDVQKLKGDMGRVRERLRLGEVTGD